MIRISGIPNRKLNIVLCTVLFVVFFLHPISASATGIQTYSESFDYIAYSYVGNINDAPINSAEHFEFVSSDAFSERAP